ncbi:MAG: ABC transporter permease [Saprospiraceae bacterium]|uniref:ABC transporter permease n=1 Tax=Candidatus Opimibacter skivensis TaxID=2982028 RepID=A0A9D7SXC7_9BACT|nr:ABC transporter permease [Candidatus Opimibacter skivensis]
MKKEALSYYTLLPGWRSPLSLRLSWLFILIVSLIAILGPLISNEKPYMCRLEGRTYFPLFSGISEAELSTLYPSFSPVEWRSTSFESIWRAPIPYSHTTIDLASGSHLSPIASQPLSLRFRHWLGTDALGRDVLAGMIRGCRVSLLIGFGSMLLALLFGVPLGSAAAYWGNRKWRVSWIQVIETLIFFILLFIIWWLPFSVFLKYVLLILLIIALAMVFRFSRTIRSKQTGIPIDTIVMSLISIVDSFPGLFIILILLVILPVKGLLTVMMAIALLRWPVMARYMRAEVFKMKESNYIKAAQLLNIPDLKILKNHLIPYAFRPVMITFIFGVSSAILAESSLSFLGIGLPPEEMNWGRLLSQSRNHFDDWWLVLFPGCAIFFTLLSLYTIGNMLKKRVEQGIPDIHQIPLITE